MDYEEFSEDLARLKALTDQANEAAKDIAGTTWSFYQGALEAGFPEAQAFLLAVEFLRGLLDLRGMAE